MIGDIKLWIKSKIKEHITCKHYYVYRHLSGIKDYRYCKYCGRCGE